MTKLIQALLCVLPWALRRRLLCIFYGYEIDSSARIGLAWVYPRKLVMRAKTSIGHFTVVKGVDLLQLEVSATIGRLNWITGYPLNVPPHFLHIHDRRPELRLGEHAAITNRHILDCTAAITVGRFATIAGFRSQFLTHSVDLVAGRQDASPIDIGDYCFVSTACTVLGGSSLPKYSVLGANALLNAAFTEPYKLYGGVPAKPVAAMDRDARYFSRIEGYVV
jgi:acetyltransferase-like isoleucine patch superfamily enzyme